MHWARSYRGRWFPENSDRRLIRTSIEERFWKKVVKREGCWSWIGSTDGNGYGQINEGGRGRLLKAHRVSYQIAFGPISDEIDVLHRCDNPNCTNPEHLFLGTHTDNMRDMWAKGRGRSPGDKLRGSKNGNSRLTEKQVLKIRNDHAKGESSRALGRRFGVSKTLILFIVKRSVWTHI